MNKRIVALVLAGSLIAGVILAFTPAGAFVAAHWLPLAIGVTLVVAFTWLCIEAVRAPLDGEPPLDAGEMVALTEAWLACCRAEKQTDNPA